MEKLEGIDCAMDHHEHDMLKLKAAILKAQSCNASDEVCDVADKLFSRLNSELGMTRAIAGIPIVRMPVENPPDGYWQEDDVGHIVETEEYPLPPADSPGGEYKWQCSASLAKLHMSIEELKACMAGAADSGANPALLQDTKDHLLKAEKDAKALDVKDVADKAIAVENAIKLAKKLKKGKGKKK